jgi:sterol 3beta-glucosyltransferase
MKIALFVHGTRGDVQPFTVLALALMERGHDVTLAVPPNLTEFVRKCGVRAEKIAVDSQAFMESEEGRKWLASGNVSAFMKRMSAVIGEHRDELIEDYQRAGASADLIVAGLLCEDFASVVAERLGVPLASVHFNPVRPTGDFPAPLVTTRQLPLRALNHATQALFDKVWWNGQREHNNVFRQRVGLPPVNRSTARRMAEKGSYTIHAFSPRLVPQPREWGAALPVLGAIHCPAKVRESLGETGPDRELADWMKAGKPPIYFGLGSMPVVDPAGMVRTVSGVTRKLGERAIVCAGWSRLDGLGELPDHVRIVGGIDHSQLFPLCGAAVHHGGSGTTFSVGAAGLPSVVCSVFADQPFWGTRLERLGVGVHLPFGSLDAARLEQVLRRVLDPGVRNAAAQLGADLRAEPDATPQIASLLERLGTSAKTAA